MLIDSIQKIRSGDLSAFGNLYDASYSKIYAFIYHRVLDDIEAQDIVSDVYMKALRSIHTFQGETEGEYFSWIYRVAYTTLIDTVRKRKPLDSLDEIEFDPGFTPDVSGDVDHKSKLEEVLTFMDSIPERERLVLTLRIWDDLSYDEISEITGVSVANAKQIVSRTLTKISANVAHIFIFSLLLNYVI